MNNSKLSNPIGKLFYGILMDGRHLRTSPLCKAFGTDCADAVQRIYVINLDRHGIRWGQMKRELASIRHREGGRLMEIVRRFSAVDARYSTDDSDKEVEHEYSLADQLFVDPQPLPEGMSEMRSLRIEMSRQEAAVARSHVAVWKLIAAGSPIYTLVLEDDGYFRWRFAKNFGKAWGEIAHLPVKPSFDLLYLAYAEALAGAEMPRVSGELLRPSRGLWQLSGYVLSKRGAQRLLDRLPVRGPVDLWINHQFEALDVFALRRPVIRQRLDAQSSNSYSVLPVLSKIGLLTGERASMVRSKALAAPVFAAGAPGTGLTALATALSMLTYRCCSDLATLPEGEHQALLRKQRERTFDAYVNVGALKSGDLIRLATAYPRARFIITTHGADVTDVTAGNSQQGENLANGFLEAIVDGLEQDPARVLMLPARHADKWQLLCEFLGCEYPSYQYPDCRDQGQRPLAADGNPSRHWTARATRPKWDSSPWIVARRDWPGLALAESSLEPPRKPTICEISEGFTGLDGGAWMLRDDTFPSNLALFSPQNFEVTSTAARLTLRAEKAIVREYTSAALSSGASYHYGRFVAELRPAKVAGLITGMFLHRDSPRQEIDIEFLGKDTTRMLVNVYYNPGYEGARLDYGYRGTPGQVELGFDAADDFHRYEIEWGPTAIEWRVDGLLVCRRVQWNPTPIPHLPMQFHINLWHTRSTSLAGRLAGAKLPAHTELRQVEIHT